MTEETRPGFVIKTAVHDAIETDDDVAFAVQRALAQLDIGKPRGQQPDHGDRVSGHAEDEFGHDVTDYHDELF